MSYSKSKKIKEINSKLTKEDKLVFDLIKGGISKVKGLIKLELMKTEDLFKVLKKLRRLNLISQTYQYIDAKIPFDKTAPPLTKKELEDLILEIRKCKSDQNLVKMTKTMAEKKYPVINLKLTKRAEELFN